MKIKEATALGLKLIKDQELTKEVVALRSLEAFEKAADGKSTKIIIPSNIQDIAGLVTSVKELAKNREEDLS